MKYLQYSTNTGQKFLEMGLSIIYMRCYSDKISSNGDKFVGH